MLVSAFLPAMDLPTWLPGATNGLQFVSAFIGFCLTLTVLWRRVQRWRRWRSLRRQTQVRVPAAASDASREDEQTKETAETKDSGQLPSTLPNNESPS